MSFFSQKKQTLQKRETVKEFLIVRAKKVDPFFFLCLCSRDSTCEKRGEKVPLSLHFTRKRIKTDTRHTRINMNPE